MSTAVVVGVVPDVTGLDRIFDYEVPEAFGDRVEIGTRVRVVLNGRRVGGWVVRIGAGESSSPVALRPLEKISGVGPDAEIVELCAWAARRWCAFRLRPFLVAASSATMVTRPAPRYRTRVAAEPSSPAASELCAAGGGVLRLPPSDDPMPTVLSAARLGPSLVVVASSDGARVLAARLRRTGLSVAALPEDWAAARGGVDVVIGARAAAFGPCPDLTVAVVIDEHDESLQEERSPTWHAREVMAERARRRNAPLLLVSPCPTLEATTGRITVAPARERERNAWPEVQVVDPGEVPPWKKSLVSSELIEYLRDATKRVACVLNTKGQARLLACRACRNLVRCNDCGGALVEESESRLECRVCAQVRPRLCLTCGSIAIVRLRPGVARLRTELEAAARRDVIEVTAGSGADFDDTRADVFVGTEAVLHRVRRVDVVAFIDFDTELLAPRFRASEQALALVARAARLVGSRRRGGVVLVQTSLGEHPVVRAAVAGDPGILEAHELTQRHMLGLPPFAAMAVIEGAGAPAFAAALNSGSTTVSVVPFRDRWLIRAPDHDTLSAACGAVERGPNVRLVVDPARL